MVATSVPAAARTVAAVCRNWCQPPRETPARSWRRWRALERGDSWRDRRGQTGPVRWRERPRTAPASGQIESGGHAPDLRRPPPTGRQARAALQRNRGRPGERSRGRLPDGRGARARDVTSGTGAGRYLGRGTAGKPGSPRPSRGRSPAGRQVAPTRLRSPRPPSVRVQAVGPGAQLALDRRLGGHHLPLRRRAGHGPEDGELEGVAAAGAGPEGDTAGTEFLGDLRPPN